MDAPSTTKQSYEKGVLAGLIWFCLNNRLLAVLVVFALIWAGIVFAPFDWDVPWIERSPIGVDAIPDIGENQQVIFTEWPGRSPQDIQDQITYPLTANLLGMAGVRSVRSTSMFGFSSVYVIFDDTADFDWSRGKIIERLGSLPAGTLPTDVTPMLGPDATALGQVFWYTLEGHDEHGQPTGGWDLDELRSIQDWTVRYALQSARGVAEVASVGGFVREYQIDVDPDAMRAAQVTLTDVFSAVQASNRDVGARTIEISNAEYVVRGVGLIENLEDIEQTAVAMRDNVPIRIADIAAVALGPALRRGALDKAGAEAVGGVVVVRYGENPLRVIQNVKAKIAEIAPGLPRKTLSDGTISHVTIVPFYDRTNLIYETLGTLYDAISHEVLITILVILILLRNMRSSMLIAGLLPLSVLMSFIMMKGVGVDANIVALSGIAIAIGTMVDMGIVICENIVRRLDEAADDQPRLQIIHSAACEVGSAMLAAIATTVVSFLPVFTMIGSEGKLFRPLAYTKTFALLSAAFTAVFVIPPMAYLLYNSVRASKKRRSKTGWSGRVIDVIAIVLITVLLGIDWLPLGPDKGYLLNILFVVIVVGSVLLMIYLTYRFYPLILGLCLRFKLIFLLLTAGLITSGLLSWRTLGREFMPSLDEGSFLYMPTTMPHASIGEALEVLQLTDAAMASIPEVKTVVGKIGRAESPLDPAPISMIETVIDYHTEYKRDEHGRLVTDEDGKAIRQWRDHISSPRDIWDEILRVAQVPGTTSAPLLQPIETRLIMLQTGMRAPMGVKVLGPNLETIERVGLTIEDLLKEVPSVDPMTVFAERIVGKPYLEIKIDRQAIARYGLRVDDIQQVIEVAIGGKPITMTVEGRHRYPVRVRYQRQRRDNITDIGRILVPAPGGVQVPLIQLADIEYTQGPQMIKSEDTFLVGYVLFDGRDGFAEVDVVEQVADFLAAHIDSGRLEIPAGVSYSFAGTYEHQVRAQKTLRVVLPVALGVIFMILYFQFHTLPRTLLVFTGIFTAWSGGFIMLWLYNQDWFLDFALLDVNVRELFNIHPYNLSVAVWVGFLALFGIATDDGVLMMTFLTQRLDDQNPTNVKAIRRAVIEAAHRRARPALMTSATTILALLPVLTSTGRGADIMIPMAIPSFGGMVVSIMDILIVPVLFCLMQEHKARKATHTLSQN